MFLQRKQGLATQVPPSQVPPPQPTPPKSDNTLLYAVLGVATVGAGYYAFFSADEEKLRRKAKADEEEFKQKGSEAIEAGKARAQDALRQGQMKYDSAKVCLLRIFQKGSNLNIATGQVKRGY